MRDAHYLSRGTVLAGKHGLIAMSTSTRTCIAVVWSVSNIAADLKGQIAMIEFLA